MSVVKLSSDGQHMLSYTRSQTVILLFVCRLILNQVLMGMYTKSRRKNTGINTQNGYQRFIHNLPQKKQNSFPYCKWSVVVGKLFSPWIRPIRDRRLMTWCNRRKWCKVIAQCSEDAVIAEKDKKSVNGKTSVTTTPIFRTWTDQHMQTCKTKTDSL